MFLAAAMQRSARRVSRRLFPKDILSAAATTFGVSAIVETGSTAALASGTAAAFGNTHSDDCCYQRMKAAGIPQGM
jgi:hypothetical protein